MRHSRDVLSLCFNLKALLLNRAHICLDSKSNDDVEALIRNETMGHVIEIELLEVYSNFLKEHNDPKTYPVFSKLYYKTVKSVLDLLEIK